ncbi:hypothetical protein HPB49_005728 [Dermacentor silvarum]|uniref:Uncharacterized protein n=1 Tax=Dermacentor silvarum TaxID=543639 RepID=A0ACB8CQ79_DERSI|nr:hypothetical protein HPB49_005728 [Dermacentor silvarum]
MVTPTAAKATMDAPEPSYAEATSSLERLKAQAALSDLDREQMECRDTDEGDDIIPHDTDTPTTRIEQDEGKEGDWQTLLTMHSPEEASRKSWKENRGAGSGYDSSSQHLGPPKKPPLKKKSRANRLPPLPKEDFKIIVRPHQVRPIKKLTAPQISEAVIMVTQRKVRGQQFLLRLKPGSNIFIISTPQQEVADIVGKITTLVINSKQHAVKAYVTGGDDTKKGVVQGLSPHTSPETLQANLPASERKEWRYYERAWEEKCPSCYPFKNTVQFGKACLQTGHRTDVCPQPHTSVCNRCGTKEPEPEHECKPTCTTCGEEHLAGSKDCKKRFKKPQQNNKMPRKSSSRISKAPSKESPPRPRWYDTDDTEDDWPPLRRQENLQAASPRQERFGSRER